MRRGDSVGGGAGRMLVNVGKVESVGQVGMLVEWAGDSVRGAPELCPSLMLPRAVPHRAEASSGTPRRETPRC